MAIIPAALAISKASAAAYTGRMSDTGFLTFANRSAKWTMSGHARIGPAERDEHREPRVRFVRLRVSERQADRVNGQRERVQTEEQVLGRAAVNQVRDRKRDTDSDVRDDPGEHHSSEELRVHGGPDPEGELTICRLSSAELSRHQLIQA